MIATGLFCVAENGCSHPSKITKTTSPIWFTIYKLTKKSEKTVATVILWWYFQFNGNVTDNDTDNVPVHTSIIGIW